MQYDFNEIDQKWQKYWADHKTFKADNSSNLPKYYVLDMFPYPSGAGLHVGHPLGYIASDIYSRFKRHQGFNVLHPIGYDSFGLPAEQYAIQTGQHPAVTTKVNIEGGTDKQGNSITGYENQLKKIGLSFDWDREIRTSNPDYYKWSQWIFIQLFNSYYCNDCNQARPIEELIEVFNTEGNSKINAVTSQTETFSAEQWKAYSEKEKSDILLNYRLTYLAEAEVNWCPALGTVLANDEVVNGVSERGGYPVIRKKMTQWMMRITAYAERLLNGLETIDWSEAIKESQKNWIGKSLGASIEFSILPHPRPLSEGEGSEKTPHRYNDYGFMTANLIKSKKLVADARENRKMPTEAEDLLWQEIRNHKLGVKFRRQHLIDDFSVDFVCLNKNLIIEIDGEYHESQKEQDDNRTYELGKLGFKVIRFKNEEIIHNLDDVLENIKTELSQRTETPLSKGEGTGVRSLKNKIQVFTTRPDTIFGVSFMTLAPEHPLVKEITTDEYKQAVDTYIEETAKRSERERVADVKTISGQFTGAYAIHPFTDEPIPIWIGDYVLAGYGTGAVMAVPAGDDRDYAFAKHFNIPINNIFEGIDISENAFTEKTSEVKLINSGFLNGLTVKKATEKIVAELEKMEIGEGKTNYRLRDAVFSRQRYWGEPVPIYFKNEIPYTIPTEFLPLELPKVEKYLPTETGEPPLGRAENWAWNEKENKIESVELIDNETIFPLELNTMPGWAGSSWYWMRYMDAHNDKEFASEKALNYWQNVDLYIGGSEHATGHLLYSRFWNKFLKDLKLAPTEEPFKKLINQGMILGNSAFVYRIQNENKFVSKSLIDNYKTQPIHVDVNIINETNNELDIEKFKNWREEFKDAEFILEDGKYIVGREVEKMSKSKYNVLNPDDICEEYGADTLRMYEMFLGPIEQSKPWNTQGLSGVHGFLKRYWNLFHTETEFSVSEEKASKAELKILHQTIKKVTEAVETFSFNTAVSAFMIAANELSKLKSNKKEVLEPLTVLLSPFAPHISEELWQKMGHSESIERENYPLFDASNLEEDSFEYPVSFNGKMRFKFEMPATSNPKEVEEEIMKQEKTLHYLEGKTPKKVIVVPKKIINIVF